MPLSFPLHRVSVLVGAPKANTSQPGVLQGGAVYICPWDNSPTQCTTIQFDSKGRLEDFREGLVSVGRWTCSLGMGLGAPAARGATSAPEPRAPPVVVLVLHFLAVSFYGPHSTLPAQPKDGRHDSETCGSHFH